MFALSFLSLLTFALLVAFSWDGAANEDTAAFQIGTAGHSASASIAAGFNEIIVTIDGSRVNFPDQGPVIVGSRTLVPVRGVFEALGFTPNWQPTTRTATLTRHDYVVILSIGSSVFTTNGVSHSLDVPAQLIGGRTMLPIRAILESIGYGVDWNPATRTVIITTGASAAGNVTHQQTPAPQPQQTPAPQPGVWRSSASYASAPYFHGATRITVPIGTPVDLTTGLFRLMAHDVFDGDITHKLTRSHNTVDTSQAGTTAVHYSVTNSRGTTITQTVYVTAEVRSNLVVERMVHSMPDADTIAAQSSGQIRGHSHCSQHLGIYMPPNSSFQIRLLDRPAGPPAARNNHNFTLRKYSAFWGENISVHFERYPDDRGNAPAPNIIVVYGGNTVTISHGAGITAHGRSEPNIGRVPMIKTPRNDYGHFTIEVTLTLTGAGSVRGLDYFHYGDTNQDEFIENWTVDRSFAVISGSAATILVPRVDRHLLTGTDGRDPIRAMGSINEILGFYNQVAYYYNKWNGFYVQAENPVHRLINSRFLVLPAYGGPGFAFAGGGNVGFSDLTVWPYLIRDWVVLHEIGHLFDGDMTRTREVNLSEIVTNVPAHMMQRKFENPNRLWLYNYRDPQVARTDLENRTLANANGNFTPGFNEGLFLIMNMLETSGDEYAAWARIRSMDRELQDRALPFAQQEQWPLADLFALGIFELSGLNMVPYLEWIGFSPSEDIRAQVFASGARIPYFLHPLTNRQTRITNNIRESEGIAGMWCAVLPSTSRGVYGSGTIALVPGDANRLMGQTLRVMDGATVVREVAVTSQTIYVPNLPIGAYTVEIPRAGDGVGHSVLFVRAAQYVAQAVDRPSDSVGEGTFVIRNQAGRYLTVVSGEISCSATRGNTVWYLSRAVNGAYFIYQNSPASGTMVDLDHNRDAEGNIVKMWRYTGFIYAQTWFFVPNGDGTYQIRTPHASQRVITGNNGAQPSIQTFQWLDEQRWTLERV